MSTHYILDGYNVLHSGRLWAHGPQENKRERFLKYLDESGIQGSMRNRLTVVLDGYAVKLERMRFQTLELVFSGDRDADSIIRDRVADAIHPGDTVVVTNDRAVQAAVKGLGARVMSCEEFFSRRSKKSVRGARQKLSKDSEERINLEFKRLWKLD